MISCFDFNRFSTQDMKKCLNLIKKGLQFQQLLEAPGQNNRELNDLGKTNVDDFLLTFLKKPNKYPYISCLLIGWLDN